MIITTSSRPNEALEAEALAVSKMLSIPFLERQKRALSYFHRLYGTVLIVSKEGLIIEYENGHKLFFHPDTAMLRIKAPRDPLIELVGLEKQSILDTSMGLASDSIVMSFSGHQVTALESQPIIYYIVKQGLQNFDTGNTAINAAMRAIQPLCKESVAYLKSMPDKAYDIIYCDPMFTNDIAESDNLAGIKPLANHARLTDEFLLEAKRVARRKIILKAHFKDTAFEDFGFTRYARPYQKFHFGVINLV